MHGEKRLRSPKGLEAVYFVSLPPLSLVISTRLSPRSRNAPRCVACVGDSSSILDQNDLFGSMTSNLTRFFFWPWNPVWTMAILFTSNLKIRFVRPLPLHIGYFAPLRPLSDRIWFCFGYSSFHLHYYYQCSRAFTSSMMPIHSLKESVHIWPLHDNSAFVFVARLWHFAYRW